MFPQVSKFPLQLGTRLNIQIQSPSNVPTSTHQGLASFTLSSLVALKDNRPAGTPPPTTLLLNRSVGVSGTDT